MPLLFCSAATAMFPSKPVLLAALARPFTMTWYGSAGEHPKGKPWCSPMSKTWLVELWQRSGLEPDDPREHLVELLAWVGQMLAYLCDQAPVGGIRPTRRRRRPGQRGMRDRR
jgi:hypothetical protein